MPKTKTAKHEAAAGEMPAAVVINSRGNSIQPSRVGHVLIGAYFPPAVRRELKLLALHEDKTFSDLFREALTDFLLKRGISLTKIITTFDPEATQ
jgi:hypothetical protein